MIYIFLQPLLEVSVTGMPFVSPRVHDVVQKPFFLWKKVSPQATDDSGFS